MHVQSQENARKYIREILDTYVDGKAAVIHFVSPDEQPVVRWYHGVPLNDTTIGLMSLKIEQLVAISLQQEVRERTQSSGTGQQTLEALVEAAPRQITAYGNEYDKLADWLMPLMQQMSVNDDIWTHTVALATRTHYVAYYKDHEPVYLEGLSDVLLQASDLRSQWGVLFEGRPHEAEYGYTQTSSSTRVYEDVNAVPLHDGFDFTSLLSTTSVGCIHTQVVNIDPGRNANILTPGVCIVGFIADLFGYAQQLSDKIRESSDQYMLCYMKSGRMGHVPLRRMAMNLPGVSGPHDVDYDHATIIQFMEGRNGGFPLALSGKGENYTHARSADDLYYQYDEINKTTIAHWYNHFTLFGVGSFSFGLSELVPIIHPGTEWKELYDHSRNSWSHACPEIYCITN
uniref:Uncharacterized protein n=1 Tax=Eutreptiella gymnastica TaxID=73025 RepID=A0A7S4CQP2_9EUGL|mmetsp:Transcript_1186/g.1838  ORF Transcript_1186/g.1838 Transcript_1186/m.1838 type:complete len:400 (+) Transcript_1186:356-1555(+)